MASSSEDESSSGKGETRTVTTSLSAVLGMIKVIFYREAGGYTTFEGENEEHIKPKFMNNFRHFFEFSIRGISTQIL